MKIKPCPTIDEQCKDCINREYRDDLCCCLANRLHYSWREFLRQLPIVGEGLSEYKCQAYEPSMEQEGRP